MEDKETLETPCGTKRKEPEPDSDEPEKEGQGQTKKKVMTIYDFYNNGHQSSKTQTLSDLFLSYDFEQSTSSSKWTWTR